jgi:hypothetical protein
VKRAAINLGCWLIVVAIMCIAASFKPAHAHDPDPEISFWMQSLIRPDEPYKSQRDKCCGESDAYWADKVFVENGKTFAVITDTREIENRPHRDVGETFEIWPEKQKWDQGNPTGHNQIFLSTGGFVYCFVQSTGT